MKSESKLILELWEHFRDSISSNKRTDAAHYMLRLFDEYGFEFSTHDLEGEDEYLDEAISLMDEEPEEDDGEEDIYDY